MNTLVKRLIRDAVIFSSLAITYSSVALALYGNTIITPGHISATMNVRMAKYYNDQLVRRQYQIMASTPLTINAPSKMLESYVYIPDTMGVSQLDSRGNKAWAVDSSSDYAIEPIIFEGTSVRWINSSASSRQSLSVYMLQSIEFPIGLDVVTLSNWTPTSRALGSSGGKTITTFSQPVMVMDLKISLDGTVFYAQPALYLDSLTINTTVSSCGVQSKQGSVVNWPPMYPEDIRAGRTDVKPYSLSLVCGNDADPKTTVDITFSALHGITANSTDTVETGLAGLGLKLTWQNPALPPLDLTKVNTSQLSGVGDYTVLAQPVSTKESLINSGSYNTSVTLDIDFH